jgi:hypothetical protein
LIWTIFNAFLLSFGLFGEKFYEGSFSIFNSDCVSGPVVQLGKTSPSRGEDRRFKSGSAHFEAFFCCTRAEKCLLNIDILDILNITWPGSKMRISSSGLNAEYSYSIIPKGVYASECRVCGEEFEKPLRASVTTGSEISEYYACPRCLSEVMYEDHDEWVADHEAPHEILLSEEKMQELSLKAAEFNREDGTETKAACDRGLGYLKKRSRDTAIPDQCLICASMIECMSG